MGPGRRATSPSARPAGALALQPGWPAGCPPRRRAAGPFPCRGPPPGLRTHPAVGRRPVSAAAARRAAGDGRPVPNGSAASVHSRCGLRPASAATLGAGPAAAPAPAAAASLAPVQFNDVVQRHIHFVGHGGRGIGLGSSPRVSTSARHFLRRPGFSGAASSERPWIGCGSVASARSEAARARWAKGLGRRR